ncbi:helix-turn-helix transcriptional regulator [Chelatococcus sp. GCM10030263]|uniref:helix-turn-helix transcriptional regulator n=1 Tax=Chelatococcus sp. GCM10030263 TaxID=3273387 RepID=UPI003619B7F0
MRKIERLQARGFLSPGEVASLIGVSEATLRSWRRSGRGPVFFKVGATVVYREQDVDRWLEAQAVDPAVMKEAV